MDRDHAEQLLAALDDAGRSRRPVVVLDLDAVESNLADLARRASGKPIRVASKSLRVRRLLEFALGAPGFAGTLCYTLAEALWLVEHGLHDLVVAYPTADADGLRRLVADDAARDKITLMVDCTDQLDLVERAVGTAGLRTRPIRVAIELDAAFAPGRYVRFGALRSPVATPADAARLARAVVSRHGFRLVGMMAYEGQVAGVGDAGRRPRQFAVRAMKRASVSELAGRRAEAVARVREVSDLEFVNAGGTGSLETSAIEDAVTEVAAGSGIIGPALFDGYSGFRPRPAVFFGLDVVRRPGPGVATLLGGGWVASGVPGRDRLPSIVHPHGLRFARDEGAGEVQTPVIGPEAARLAVGDVVWLRHAKAGEPAERVTEYVVVSRAAGRLRVVDTWPTYRGEGLVTV